MEISHARKCIAPGDMCLNIVSSAALEVYYSALVFVVAFFRSHSVAAFFEKKKLLSLVACHSVFRVVFSFTFDEEK